MESLSIQEDTVIARTKKSELSKKQPYYLIKTYTFYSDGECKGYDVVRCDSPEELLDKANQVPNGASNLRNILTSGLELKLEE